MLTAVALSLGAFELTGLSRGQGITPTGTRLTAASDRVKIGTLDVPRLGLGTIAWTPENEEDIARYEAVARAAMADGLTLFDTAERYGAKGSALIPAALAAVGLPVANDYLGGDTETRLGDWARGGTVMTKFAPTPWRGDAQAVVEACQGSAERLGVDAVDLMQVPPSPAPHCDRQIRCIRDGRARARSTRPSPASSHPQVHMPDIIQPFKAFGYERRREEAHWEGLAQCYHSGLAKNVGVSNYGPTLLARCHKYLAERGVPLASNQIHFNLLYRRQGSLATVEACGELGVACLAYYPLAMGLLTGKLTGAALRGRTDLRARELLRYLEGGQGGGFPNTAGDIPEGGVRSLLIVLQEVASRYGKTPAQVSLNWIMCKGAIPIPGASSAMQVRDNAGALGWRLDESDVALLDAAADELPFEFRGSGFQTADSKFVGYGFERWRLD